MARKRIFLKALKEVEENKKTYAEKREETLKCQARLPEMQKYVDLSQEKRGLLLNIIKNGKSSDSVETLLDKGVIVYIKHIEVIETIANDLAKEGIMCYIIQGKTKQSERGNIAKEFKNNPNSKVILISNAAGESLNLNATNEIILYNLPDGSGKFDQIIGRIARNFSKFEDQGRSFYIHYVIVDDTIDEYKPILLSSKKELQEEILHADTIPLKKNTGSFNAYLLKEIRKDILWKHKGKVRKRRRNTDDGGEKS